MFLNKKEYTHLIITAFIGAFIISFRRWGDEVFDPIVGITNLTVGFIFAIIIITIKLFVQKKIAVKKQYEFEFKPWHVGGLVGVLLAIVSYGHITYFSPGSFEIEQKKKHSVGKLMQGLDIKDKTKISIMGGLTTALITLVFKLIFSITQDPILKYGMLISTLITCFSLLPLPNNDGMHILYNSRPKFFFTFILIISFTIGLWFIPWILALISSAILALFGILLYFKYWHNP